MPHQQFPPDLAAIDDSCLDQSLLWHLQNDDFPSLALPLFTCQLLAHNVILSEEHFSLQNSELILMMYKFEFYFHM